jgi:hypothetical protein
MTNSTTLLDGLLSCSVLSRDIASTCCLRCKPSAIAEAAGDVAAKAQLIS